MQEKGETLYSARATNQIICTIRKTFKLKYNLFNKFVSAVLWLLAL